MVEEENNLVFVLIGEIYHFGRLVIDFYNLYLSVSFSMHDLYPVVLQMKWKALLQLGKLLYLVLNLQIQFG